jgi:uncharacterized phage protein (TIGR02218 family)
MRKIEAELQGRLDSGATTLCTCWIVTRRDGVVLGFTDHDEDVDVDGVTCAALSSVAGSAQEVGLGLGIDSTEIDGALDSAAITAADIAAGIYDDAAVDRLLVDWSAPHLRLHLFRGHLGTITREGAAFRAELLGLSARLNAPVGRVCQHLCDASLGDARCGIDLARPDLTVSTTIREAGLRGVALDGLDGFAPDWFAHGRLVWLSGASVGREVAVLAHWVEDGVHWLALDTQTRAQTGDACRVMTGCDREARTCRDKFANLVNFRGFPHLPGEDWALTASPVSGERHDGGARS